MYFSPKILFILVHELGGVRLIRNNPLTPNRKTGGLFYIFTNPLTFTIFM